MVRDGAVPGIAGARRARAKMNERSHFFVDNKGVAGFTEFGIRNRECGSSQLGRDQDGRVVRWRDRVDFDESSASVAYALRFARLAAGNAGYRGAGFAHPTLR